MWVTHRKIMQVEWRWSSLESVIFFLNCECYGLQVFKAHPGNILPSCSFCLFIIFNIVLILRMLLFLYITIPFSYEINVV